MQRGMQSATFVLQAVGATPPIAVSVATKNGVFGHSVSAVPFQPSIIAALSPAADLTYNIEVTNDDVLAPGYNPATGNWFEFSTSTTGASASSSNTLGAAVSAIRARIVTWESGTLTFSFGQVV
jgi:hypothetical protein